MQPKTALIIGANSAIARAIARRLLTANYSLLLISRDAAGLAAFATQSREAGGNVKETYTLDLCDHARVESVFVEIRARFGGVDLAIVCHGVMHDNAECIGNFDFFTENVETNFTSVALCMMRSFALLEGQSGAELVVLSSVAGDRGRAKNYCYGSTKAAINAFAEGMRLASRGRGVNILCVKPGPVDTPMSAMVKDKGWWWSQPDEIARVVCAELGRGRSTVYAPRYWRYVMWVVKKLPLSVLAWSGI